MSRTFRLSNGDEIPALGLGTWKSEPGEVGAALREAIGAGYRHIDCAAIYMNEREVGQAIAEAIAEGDVRREDLWITSKLWNCNHLAADVRPGLEQTLADLGLDYLDLYLIHWPVAFKPGVTFPRQPVEYLSPDEAPIAQTWAELENAVDDGLCRNIGLSNFSAAKCRAIVDGARIAPTVNQVELHPILAQPDLLASCADMGIHLTAHSPLGSGDRPDVMKRSDEPQPMEHRVVHAIADRNQASPAQVLIAWAIQRGTSVIPKSVNPEHIRQNIDASDMTLSDIDMAEMNALDRAERIVLADFFCPPGSPYTVEWMWA